MLSCSWLGYFSPLPLWSDKVKTLPFLVLVELKVTVTLNAGVFLFVFFVKWEKNCDDNFRHLENNFIEKHSRTDLQKLQLLPKCLNS